MNIINLSKVDNLQETINELDYGQVVLWNDKQYVILCDSKSDDIYLHPCGCNPETTDIAASTLIK